MDMDLVSCKCSEDLLKDPRHDLSIKFRYQRVCFSLLIFFTPNCDGDGRLKGGGGVFVLVYIGESYGAGSVIRTRNIFCFW